ncbi:MAG: hypothetical protein DI576_09325 [Actinomyces sp.]|nr:MAG: hypothetical protein DI576_09325 [Actinomyces sp.]
MLASHPSSRSVEFRVEIGSLPRRDRFTSAPRSVEFRTEIGPVSLASHPGRQTRQRPMHPPGPGARRRRPYPPRGAARPRNPSRRRLAVVP